MPALRGRVGRAAAAAGLGEGGHLWPIGRERGRPNMAAGGWHGQSAAASIISQKLDMGRRYNRMAQMKVEGLPLA